MSDIEYRSSEYMDIIQDPLQPYNFNLDSSVY